MIALAAAASRFPGFARWVCAAQHTKDDVTPAARADNYQPQFFTAPEFAMLDQLTELILPRDESPGAREAGVAEFIDFMAAADAELQWPFRYGLDWINARARALHGAEFQALSAEQQTALLRPFALRDRDAVVSKDADGQRFFALLRRYTAMGYYTSHIGMEELSYPGLKFYSESPACPHQGDPEHKHLPPPVV
jgi:gluconate 2-dehydrogenase gamma chain